MTELSTIIPGLARSWYSRVVPTVAGTTGEKCEGGLLVDCYSQSWFYSRFVPEPNLPVMNGSELNRLWVALQTGQVFLFRQA